MKNLKFILIIWALGLNLTIQASVWVVNSVQNSGHGTFRAICDSASNNDTIRFNPQLIANGSDTISLFPMVQFQKSLTIVGLYNNQDTLCIKGSQYGAFGNFGVDFLKLDSIVMINSFAYSGNIPVSGIDSLVVKNSIFRNNYSSHEGGAISFNNADSAYVLIQNCKFENNYAEEYGGAIAISTYSAPSVSEIYLVDSKFSGNYSDEYGGAVCGFYYGSGAGVFDMWVDACRFQFNQSALNGGALFFSTSAPNSANAVSHLEVNSSTFIQNSSTGKGAGIYANGYNGVLKVNNSYISENSATSLGGGVYSWLLDSCSINKTTIDNNSASDGGGVYVFTNSILSLEIEKSTISNNTSTQQGGGIYCRGFRSFFSSKYSTIANNNSSGYGGGLFIEGMYSYASINMENSTLVYNASSSNYNTGIYSKSYNNNQTSTVLKSNIMAFNGDSTFYDTKSPNIQSLGNNIFSDANILGGIFSDQLNMDSVQLKLGVLGRNGGDTKTVMPHLGSVAIDNGDPNNSNDAQNVPIVGVRDAGAAEMCYSTYAVDSIVSCSTYYTWINGVTYTKNNYSDTHFLVNVAGCDSLVSLHLTIPSLPSTDTVVACDSFTWINGSTYQKSTNTVTDTLVNLAGCDSVVTLNLTILKSSYSTDIHTTCDSLTWIDGVTYYSSNNTATDTLINAVGCDSVVFLNLTVNYSNSSFDTVIACDSLTWIDGVTYYSSNNTATDTLINTVGCDSVVFLNLTVNYSNSSIDTVIACDSLTWIDGVTYYSSNNTATDTLINAVGCDSVVFLNLTVNYSNSSIDTVIACDSLTWIDGVTYYSSNNTATDTLINAVGCDSIVSLSLTLNYSNSSTDYIIACDSLTWINGVTYFMSTNSESDTLVSGLGCDSVIYLDLTINQTILKYDTLVACDSLTWINGVTYYSDTNNVHDTLQSVSGCDSINILNLTIGTITTSIDTQLVCDSLDWLDGNTYYSNNNTAVFIMSGANSLGCDSVITLNLTILNSPITVLNEIACDSFAWNGITYTSSTNTPLDTLLNQNGCDSILNLNLTINYSTSGTDSITACDSYTWINGITYYASNNTDIDTLQSVGGCDSVLHLDLTILTIDSTVVQNADTLAAVAQGLSYQWIDCATNTAVVGAVAQEFVPTISGNYKVEISNGICIDTSACYQVNLCYNQASYTFTDNGSGDFDFTDGSLGTYSQIHWSFGDGATSTSTSPNHVYQANGNYVVVLTINDSNTSAQCVSYFMDTISVTGVGTPVVCQAGFSVYYDTVNASVSVVNSSVGSNLTYSWDFGDGTSSTLQYPSHSYATNGPFNLCLTIDDGNGCADTYCDSISNQGVWFRAAGFELIVEGAEPNSITKIDLSNNINIYPNPVHDQVNIEITNWPANGVVIVVRDMSGKKVFTQELEPISNNETISINTSNWAKGIYFIEVSDEVNRVTVKIVVQ